jgi:ATP/maltotriose-dependent transcriptional regulator MalT
MHMDSARDRIEEIVHVYETVEQGVVDTHIKSLMQCHRAAILALSGRFAEAVEIGLQGLESVDDEAVFVRAVAPIAAGLTMEGRIDEALAMTERALEPALRVQERLPRAPAMVVFPRITALFFAGRFEEALMLIDLALKSNPNVSTSVVADANAFQGRMHLSLGRPLTAARLLRDANVTLRNYADIVEPGWCLSVEAEAHALLGHLEVAANVMAEVASKRQAGYAIFEPDRDRAMAWMDAQNGRTSAAIQNLWQAADLAAGRGQRCVEVFILEDLLRLGERRAIQRTLEVTALVDGDWAAAVNLHAVALQSSGGADHMVAAEAFGAMGCALIAAELWFTASTAFQQEGLKRRAAEAARYGSDFLAQCEGARTSALAVSPVTQQLLTRRERETAELASRGSSSGEIAEQLSMSVRTVESHLYSVFAKLGITERGQLAEAMKSQTAP